MFKCQYCTKETHSKQGNAYHEKRCVANSDRVAYYWEGKTHSTETKIQIAKTVTNNKVPKSIFDMSSRTRVKVLKRLGIGCSLCGWNEASCDIHHIIPKSKNGTDEHNNLTYICPNCHRLAHSGKIQNYVSLQEQINDVWLTEYCNTDNK
jgi:5-methylcytosine-specific restriction endonuclease McrA